MGFEIYRRVQVVLVASDRRLFPRLRILSLDPRLSRL